MALRAVVGREGGTGMLQAPRPGWEVMEDGWCSVLRLASLTASARTAYQPGRPPSPAPASEPSTTSYKQSTFEGF